MFDVIADTLAWLCGLFLFGFILPVAFFGVGKVQENGRSDSVVRAASISRLLPYRKVMPYAHEACHAR